MNILDFLNKLENTLEEIEVKGRNNHDRLMGCFIAIDQLRQALLNATKDGEENGRQTDIPTDGSNDSIRE